jgi:histidine triad (HIT) family protein
MEECIFCKIINKKISTEVVYEDKDILAFKDIHPLAPVHILILPKKHIVSISEIGDKDQALMGRIILTAKKIADSLDISKSGYKLLFRVGRHGGQEVEHIHLHLIGGSPLFEDIHPVKNNL